MFEGGEWNEKLLVIIVGLFSLLMVYLSVKEVNIIQGTNLYLADYTIADYFNETNYSLSISGNNFETIYNALVEFAGNEEITYVYSYEKNDDQLMYTILNRYIFQVGMMSWKLLILISKMKLISRV